MTRRSFAVVAAAVAAAMPVTPAPAPAAPLAPPTDDEMVSYAQSVWDYIASDYLALEAECGNKKGYVTGKTLQETVPDHFGCGKAGNHDDRRCADHWRTLDRAHQDKILKKAFPSREKFGY